MPERNQKCIKRNPPWASINTASILFRIDVVREKIKLGVSSFHISVNVSNKWSEFLHFILFVSWYFIWAHACSKVFISGETAGHGWQSIPSLSNKWVATRGLYKDVIMHKYCHFHRLAAYEQLNTEYHNHTPPLWQFYYIEFTFLQHHIFNARFGLFFIFFGFYWDNKDYTHLLLTFI